jgi:hypothetical protein
LSLLWNMHIQNNIAALTTCYHNAQHCITNQLNCVNCWLNYCLKVSKSMHHTFNDVKSYYKITIYSDMFQWQPPPKSGKVHLVSWNTAVVQQLCTCSKIHFTSGLKWILLRVNNSVLERPNFSLQGELSLMMVVAATETYRNIQWFCNNLKSLNVWCILLETFRQ